MGPSPAAVVLRYQYCSILDANISLVIAVCQSVSLYVCLSVCPSACISAVPTGRIFVKFDIGDFYENLSALVKIGQYEELHMRT
jgi:hypothetical protein